MSAFKKRQTGKRQTAVVICPGRGTYNAPELGYLQRYHAGKGEFLAMIDDLRRQKGQVPVSELDAATAFSPALHGRGDHASMLIFAAAMADFQDIDQERYDIVGVTGNSMGWYLALTAGGAVDLKTGAQIVAAMSEIVTQNGRGGQMVYSCLDDNWQVSAEKTKALDQALKAAREANDLFAALSIDLGGMKVLAGDEAGLDFLAARLPKDGRFPFRIKGHSGFHTSLMDGCVPLARAALPEDIMSAQPSIPLIDGLGNIWRPFASDLYGLYDYTFGRQINQSYNFTRAVVNAAKEYAPDVFIVLGPGTTLGAPTAQSLISAGWEGLTSKADFKARQDKTPIILSMGMEDQRALVAS